MTQGATASRLLEGLSRRPALSLLVLCLVVWLPGALTLPPLDRDESRFAQASKQMVETGDFVDIRFSTGVRYNKPVGIYWLQAASAEILGGPDHARIWAYRVPSLLGGYLALLLVYWCGRAFLAREVAFAAAALLGATVLMTAETQIATTDAVLLAATMGAQAVLFRIYLAARDPVSPAPSRLIVLAGWFAFAIGALVKGPVVIGVLGVTALAVSLWDRKWRWLGATQPLAGLLVVALVVLPWLITIGVQSHGAFFRQSLGHDFGDKLVGGQESHGAPPGYYLLLATLTLWPAILFVLPAISAAWRKRDQPALRYLLAWAGASWLLFELTPTKLPHYILPTYPALVLLASSWVFAPPKGADAEPHRGLTSIAIAQFILGATAFAVVAIVAPLRFGGGLPVAPLAIAAAGLVIGAIAIACVLRRRADIAWFASIAAAVLLIPMLTLGVAPRLGSLWVSPRAAALERKDTRAGDPPPIIAGYVEPSLIFLLGTDTRIGTGASVAPIAARQGGLALIEDRERAAFLGGLAARDVQAFAVDDLSGFDYSHGRKVHITIYRVAGISSPHAE